ncbi:recombinase family protein [Butyrivibrio sp. TB]|uniref:recombinase family protein n=1 Tax=Butyrivibrio sp. TB TaxID=1520809 RepID=UPI0008C1961D|nr:recombinase family protein [Butyrivibrio sp. TB]SEQ56452.1 Site-specific DNA recombinase [Butyrivibrio sp. TB]
MKYSDEEVKKAAEVLFPECRKYETSIRCNENILGTNDDETYSYDIFILKKGKKIEVATLRNKHVSDALKTLLKTYGYCRISTPQQSIDRQIRNIKAAYPNAYIVQEAFTGTKMDRPEWKKLMKNIAPGDIIVFDSVSRMSRNADEGVETYFELYEKRIQLVFLKEPYINTEVYAENMKDKIELQGTDEDEIFKGLNNYFRKLAEKQIRIAFDQAEKEVQDLHQRTKEGIQTARLNGKQIGQRRGNKLTVKKEAPAKDIIMKHSKTFNGTLSDIECIKLTGLSRNTYYKYKSELKASEENS